MSLQDWAKNGWLRQHTPTASEIADLFAVADRDLHDCRTRGLSEDWQFGIAYNAALQLARAALQTEGFETPKGEAHHFRAIQSLLHTIVAPAPFVDLLDTFRKKRSASVYDHAGLITRTDAQEMVKLATKLRRDVETFIQKTKPSLLSQM